MKSEKSNICVNFMGHLNPMASRELQARISFVSFFSELSH